MSSAEGKGGRFSQLLHRDLARKEWWETRAQTHLQFSLPTASSEILIISAPKKWAEVIRLLLSENTVRLVLWCSQDFLYVSCHSLAEPFFLCAWRII